MDGMSLYSFPCFKTESRRRLGKGKGKYVKADNQVEREGTPSPGSNAIVGLELDTGAGGCDGQSLDIDIKSCKNCKCIFGVRNVRFSACLFTNPTNCSGIDLT